MCPNKHDLSGLDKYTEKNENCMILLKMSLEKEEESKQLMFSLDVLMLM